MIAYFADRGANVVFNTNGVLLDERRGDAVTEAGLSEVRVSLDAATAETFKVVRGADVLPKILRNVAAFTARRAQRGETRPLVSIWATTLKENLDELPDLVRLAADVGVRRVHLQRLVFNGIGLAVEEQSVFRDLSDRQEKILATCRRVAAELGVDLSGSGGTDGGGAFGDGVSDELAWQGCRRPWKVLYVTAQGTVMPCCIAPFATTDIPAISLGNVSGGVGRVWNGAAMRNFRTRHQSPDPPVPCGPCGSQWSL
jgi:MoaA/NifB/PqqE/SkfB family radical SAM enzyme